MQKTLVEALAVAVLGLLVALAANALSPRGLKISRNYFPAAVVQPETNAPQAVIAPAAGTNVSTPQEGGQLATNTPGTSTAIERLRAKGLQHVLTEEAVTLYRDPGYQAGTIIFLDARDDDEYAAGHIPGAYQLFHYRPEKYLPVVLQVTQLAQKIVVYCNGGDCEDSEFTAQMLGSAGVALDKIRVYLGGFTEWKTNNLPVEIGGRMSGVITNAN